MTNQSTRKSSEPSEVSSKANKSSEHSDVPISVLQSNTSTTDRVSFLTNIRACVAMMNVLESQHEKSPMIPEPPFYNPPDNSLNETKLEKLEDKIFDIEQKIKAISRRINECRHGQMLLKERIEELENSMSKSRKINVIQDLLNVIPTEEDLAMLERLKDLETKRKEVNAEIRNVDKQNKVLNKILGRAEAIITDTEVIKKKKRVVIIEEEPMFAEINVGESLQYKGFLKVSEGPSEEVSSTDVDTTGIYEEAENERKDEVAGRIELGRSSGNVNLQHRLNLTSNFSDLNESDLSEQSSEQIDNDKK